MNIRIIALFFLSLFLLTGGMVGQSPTPRPEEPEVVSRDGDDVRETVADKPAAPRTTTRRLPRSITRTEEPEFAVTNSSPYQISLSQAQKKMLLYLDILTKTEARAEALRSRIFELIEKENSVRARIKVLEYSLRPQEIQNSAALSGSLRPEQVREQRAAMLNAEKRSNEDLLRQIEANRRDLESAIVGADRLVRMVRERFEVYVEQALIAEAEVDL